MIAPMVCSVLRIHRHRSTALNKSRIATDLLQFDNHTAWVGAVQQRYADPGILGPPHARLRPQGSASESSKLSRQDATATVIAFKIY